MNIVYLDSDKNTQYISNDDLQKLSSKALLTKLHRNIEDIKDAFSNSKSQRWVNDCAMASIIEAYYNELMELRMQVKKLESQIKDKVHESIPTPQSSITAKETPQQDYSPAEWGPSSQTIFRI